jgi:signal transduction histidine kinase/ActR/RegA family two-component response regulator
MIVRSLESGAPVRVNREFVERLGLTREELEAQPLLEWIHPDDRPKLEMVLSAEVGAANARHRTKAGDWLPFAWQVKMHSGCELAALGLLLRESDADDEPAEVDTSGPRKTMSEILEAMALIVESKNPGMRCSILLLDEAREYVMGGAGPSLPREYNEAVEGLRIGPAVGSCGTAAFWNVPVVVECIEEDPLWVDLRGAAALAGVSACWSHPITATSGDVLGAMALYHDEPRAPDRHQMDGLEIAARMVGLAVERERLEDQLRQSAKMEALGVLAGGIAHDFKNMLAVILANAELATPTLPEGAEARERLQEIATASVGATDLCNQMLAYAGRGARTAERLDFNALVKELGGLLRVALSKKATLVFELHEGPLGVLADRGQLRQVVMNLITNASEAIGNNEGLIVVETSPSHYGREELALAHPEADLEPGDYVLLSVSDSGTGVDSETRARIFDPFFTTKSAGRGLGLAAVQGIVRGHRGAVTLESEPGHGTTIHVLLPGVALPHQEPPSVSEDQPTEPDARILVVDDEEQVLKLIATMLERAGYDVIVACDGQEAVDIFRREGDSIDCVRMDLSMPKLDGEEAFRELRAIRSDVRVVLSSGFTEQQVMDRFRDSGLAGVVQKPAQRDVLLAKIAETLAGTKARA